MPKIIDVLCIGHASYDLIFSVTKHPKEDDKIFAENFQSCGGGPAANAAVMAAKLGFSSAFAGYLGNDLYGDKHLQELIEHGIDIHLIKRGRSPTPLSTIIVKPDGKRALINYKGDTQALAAEALDFTTVRPKTILFDGHEPNLSETCLKQLPNIPTVLDAGSLHPGTQNLLNQVDYLACSEKFAKQYAGDVTVALAQLAEHAPVVIITLGEHGLIWRRGQEEGRLPAFPVTAIDTTGAGDAFHGALAAAIAANMNWPESLRYASAAGALCCTQTGARTGLPTLEEMQTLLN